MGHLSTVLLGPILRGTQCLGVTKPLNPGTNHPIPLRHARGAPTQPHLLCDLAIP